MVEGVTCLAFKLSHKVSCCLLRPPAGVQAWCLNSIWPLPGAPSSYQLSACNFCTTPMSSTCYNCCKWRLEGDWTLLVSESSGQLEVSLSLPNKQATKIQLDYVISLACSGV